MRFLFRLDLSLHTGVGKKIEILNFTTKQNNKSQLIGQTARRNMGRRLRCDLLSLSGVKGTVDFFRHFFISYS